MLWERRLLPVEIRFGMYESYVTRKRVSQNCSRLISFWVCRCVFLVLPALDFKVGFKYWMLVDRSGGVRDRGCSFFWNGLVGKQGLDADSLPLFTQDRVEKCSSLASLMLRCLSSFMLTRGARSLPWDPLF